MLDITNHNPPNIKLSIKFFYLFNTSANYVILCILNMNNNKSVSCDKVPIK